MDNETAIKPWKTLKAAQSKAQEVGGRVQGIDHDMTGKPCAWVVFGAYGSKGTGIFHRGGLEYYSDLSAADQVRVEVR